MADMALDDFVQKGNWRGRSKGGFRGRGKGRFQDGGGRNTKPKGSALSRIGPRNGDIKDVNGVSTGDLRDKIATKTKAHVGDLREKLAPKPPPPQPPRTKPYPKMSLTTSRSSRSSNSNRAPSHYAPSTTRIQVSHSQTVYGQEPPITPPHSRSAARSLPQFRLPSEAEAKKITVTVPGLTKTTSEAYRREERLAATIMRQKEARQQSYMKSREHFIASSITSAFGGGEKERPPPARVYSKQYRSPSPPPPPPPVYHHNPPYSVDYSEPRGIPSSGRPKGVTTVTTMVISNLNTTVSKNDIFELCNAVGPVDTVTIAAPGVAEVTFRYKDDALEAFRKYNQRNLDGQAMICHLQSGVSSRARGPPATSYRMSHTDMYPGDAAGYSHTRPYYS